MAELKDKKTSRHLRSARQWLAKAEESFDSDRDIRGELDIFLAEAELQHAKEASKPRRLWQRYPLLAQGAAFCFAAAISATVYAAYGWLAAPVTVSSEPAVLQSSAPELVPKAPVLSQPPVVPQPPVEAAVVRQEPPQTPAVVQPVAAVTPTSSVERVVSPSAAPSEVKRPVSPEEMRSLIRAAGKSLRGE